jgi:hypothetical protein
VEPRIVDDAAPVRRGSENIGKAVVEQDLVEQIIPT